MLCIVEVSQDSPKAGSWGVPVQLWRSIWCFLVKIIKNYFDLHKKGACMNRFDDAYNDGFGLGRNWWKIILKNEKLYLTCMKEFPSSSSSSTPSHHLPTLPSSPHPPPQPPHHLQAPQQGLQEGQLCRPARPHTQTRSLETKFYWVSNFFWPM